MYYYLCIIYYVLFIMYYLLCIIIYVLFIMYYYLCFIYYVLCILSFIIIANSALEPGMVCSFCLFLCLALFPLMFVSVPSCL